MHTRIDTHTGGCIYSFVYFSSKWTRTVSETCRGIINQVKQKLHLVGYLLTRYLKMHGTMNVKKKQESNCKAIPLDLDRLLELQEFESPRFPDYHT